MSLVVSDTSPLRALYHLKEHELLYRLYGEILVPPAVAKELSQPRRNSVVVEVRTIAFISVRAATDQNYISELMKGLDPGEAEAIALAKEVGAETLLMDELAGRAVAANAGLRTIGVLGILGLAKEKGLLSDVRSRLDRLRNETRFFVAQTVYEKFLRSIGE